MVFETAIETPTVRASTVDTADMIHSLHALSRHETVGVRTAAILLAVRRDEIFQQPAHQLLTFLDRQMLQLQCGRHDDFALESLTARIDRRRALDSDSESRVHRERNSEPLQRTCATAKARGGNKQRLQKKRERERMLKEESARSK